MTPSTNMNTGVLPRCAASKKNRRRNPCSVAHAACRREPGLGVGCSRRAHERHFRRCLDQTDMPD
jgi:hypothetical protein